MPSVTPASDSPASVISTASTSGWHTASRRRPERSAAASKATTASAPSADCHSACAR